ncbi:MAG: cytochrome C biogenesis protein [Candidatus Vogelbacteria bacterium CG10_big_fil_rev_8_21_14_0_10_45_14]|uniref:Cytochrome C biogenesis protein n=2 Tax=Parcubacteria group TaxID=1794811 RepID=A0A2H0RIU8_9BACT|nr:MAG: cytochrome C biogenesis protein [Candidatus Vogelbacteria bacterium CG10_big_fil_rev_8_21_14_0_10_45_14]PJA33114.1 MAG: cytochrome C biogenesis protein [Candidatus Zambryskibacteria bacterium CG_4_9_14_3_um_filter_42_15]
MIELSVGFILASFFAGLLTFLAPCTLPLVPAYLGFISGVDQEALKNPETAKAARRRIFWNGLAFIIGFSFVFITFGVLAGIAGTALAPYRIWLARIGGVLVIIFGLFMLDFFKLPFFQTDKRIPIPKWLTLGKPSSSLFIGGTFALGWTPCVGPILGSILLLAGTSGTALTGGVMLTVFSIGLAIPFLLIALAFSKATAYIDRISKYLKTISVIGGVFLILLGLLLATDNFGLTIQYGYELLDFIDYDRLLDYL